ncbi:MAG: LysR family transcriptional regulator [Planctomicrobium sp.]|jgi:DNA-binding transcriptional LysR family regulator|nr:LysR family transcriptional regulator [Planctomicrobium sp.]
MNLRNTEIFCEIATHRSFSKAASVRQISQPAVSQALQQLEEHLGVTLIDRSQRPIQLTSEGTIYHDRCQKWLQDYREIEDSLHQSSGRLTGRVRVASIYSVGLLQMADYVTRFRNEFPDVDLTLNYARPDDVYSQLLRDEVDLGIVSFPKDGGDIGSVHWQDQEMVLAVACGHPLAVLDSISLSQIDGENVVAFTNDLMIRRKTEKLLKKSNLTVNVVHQFDNLETIKRAVEINLGVAILPLATLRRELEFNTLKSIPFSDCDFVRPLGIVHKRHKHLSRAAEKFVELLHEDLPPDETLSNKSPDFFSANSEYEKH